MVAVELSAFYDEGLQQAWKASPEEFRQVLYSHVKELPKRNDGVGSVAMIDMLSRLHALKAGGADIDIVAFNGARDETQQAKFAELPGQEPHEAAQAENIRIAAEARDYRHIVILVGSRHAAKDEYTRAEIPWKPMAMKLGASSTVVSLRMQHSGGEMWNCRVHPDADMTPDGVLMLEDVTCGRFYEPARSRQVSGPAMQLWDENSDSPTGYDGFYFVGTVSASEPAVASD